MDNMNRCKKCGKEIAEGKFCKACEVERKEKARKGLAIGGSVLGTIASIAIAIISLGKNKD